MVVRFWEQAAIIAGGVGCLSAVKGVLDGLLADVLVGSVGSFLVEVVFALLFVALSSSSDEMSTTIWADIIGYRLLADLASLNFAISQE